MELQLAKIDWLFMYLFNILYIYLDGMHKEVMDTNFPSLWF